MRSARIALAAFAVVLQAGAALADPAASSSAGFTLSSSAFADGQEIPARYTCEGRDVSPPLRWSAPPAGSKSLALVLDDPDAPDPAAPKTTFVHWVVVDLPPAAGSLAEDAAARALPGSARSGRNDFGHASYGGPCPPVGRHRYVHKLYALDVVLPQLAAPSAAELERAMAGHVLAQAVLVGSYEKHAR